jgi:hypothetical protein
MVLKDSIAVLIAAGDRAPRKNAKRPDIAEILRAAANTKSEVSAVAVASGAAEVAGNAVPQGGRRGVK